MKQELAIKEAVRIEKFTSGEEQHEIVCYMKNGDIFHGWSDEAEFEKDADLMQNARRSMLNLILWDIELELKENRDKVRVGHLSLSDYINSVDNCENGISINYSDRFKNSTDSELVMIMSEINEHKYFRGE